MFHPDLETLEKSLKSHDWYYEYSDDHRVWRHGKEQREEIRRQMDICCGLGFNEIAKKLYDKYCPF